MTHVLYEEESNICPVIPGVPLGTVVKQTLLVMRRVQGRWVGLGRECENWNELKTLLQENGGLIEPHNGDAILTRTHVSGERYRYTVLRIRISNSWRVVPKEEKGDPNYPLPGLGMNEAGQAHLAHLAL
jgi:hypothetical protein